MCVRKVFEKYNNIYIFLYYVFSFFLREMETHMFIDFLLLLLLLFLAFFETDVKFSQKKKTKTSPLFL